MVDRNYDGDDEKPDAKAGVRYEFECPACNAHNPYADGFRPLDEIVCFYCGTAFRVLEGERLKLKEV